MQETEMQYWNLESSNFSENLESSNLETCYTHYYK